MLVKHTWAFLLLVILGVLFRLGFVLAADSRQLTFHSGGSDAPVYALLAENLLSHKGFTYAGQPSAFRPPGYPLLLAAFMEVFGHHYITAVRVSAVHCGSAHRTHLRKDSATHFWPGGTTSYSDFWSLLAHAHFLDSAVDDRVRVRIFDGIVFSVFGRAAGEGRRTFRVRARLDCRTGVADAFQCSNPAVLCPGGGHRRPAERFGCPAKCAVLLLSALVVLPWMIRNASVFPGHVLYSTHTGANAVQGVVNTEGRTQPGDTEKLKAAMGWCVQDLETNDSARLALPSETDLNRHALRVVPQLWREQGWNAVPLLAKKIADFWLSTDQFLRTQSLPATERAIRIAGVSIYWMVLSVAMAGLYHLRKTRPELAAWVTLYLSGSPWFICRL